MLPASAQLGLAGGGAQNSSTVEIVVVDASRSKDPSLTQNEKALKSGDAGVRTRDLLLVPPTLAGISGNAVNFSGSPAKV